jgi:uncharacterized protein DUF6448
MEAPAMRLNMIIQMSIVPLLAFGLALGAPARVLAHCDGLDGPVVKAAQKALDTRNLDFVLIWVQAEDEPEIRSAFEQALAVRALSAQAQQLADRYFFEAVVRVHRAGEGAAFTGLKPAGRDLGPAIPAADKALDDRSAEPLIKLLTGTMQERLREQFERVLSRSAFPPDDVATGRAYVKAYVAFIHYVERLYEASITDAHGHEPDPAALKER